MSKVGKKGSGIDWNATASPNFSLKKKSTRGDASYVGPQVVSEKTTLEEVLDRKGVIRNAFAAFVRERFAAESLMMYEACVDYKEKAEAGTGAEELAAMGKKIVEEHVLDTAPNAVDLPHTLQIFLVQTVKNGECDKHTFDKACGISKELLRANFFNKFVDAQQ